MISVNALDTLVHSVVYTLWALFLTAFLVGAVCLHRHNAGQHRNPAEAVDTGHRPAHAAPPQPPLWARLVAAYLADAREMAPAHALLRGVHL